MLEPEVKQNDLSASKSVEHSFKADKDLCESAIDSGFLSGPQANYSTEFDSAISITPKENEKEKCQTLQIDTYVDSGVIDDQEKSDFSSEHMISHGNEIGLADRFKNLNVKESTSTNNLSKDKSEKTQQQKAEELQANIWKLLYRQDEEGDTQLHIAIINEIPNRISAIIQLTPQPWLLDIKNDDAQAPLHLAVLTGQPNVVRHLLIAGAKASIRDGNGNTPLHLACIQGDILSIQAILAPITSAELKSYGKSINQTVPSRPDLEQKNFMGKMCVHIATQKSHQDILRHLISAGADINAREGCAGYTPLHIAVENNNEKLVKFLLESTKRLNTEAMNYRQITAYQLARELRLTDICEGLEKSGCQLLSPPDSDYEEDSDGSSDFDF